MAYDDDPIEYEYAQDDDFREESKRRGCLILFSVLLIIAMIGISLPSLFWLLSLRPESPEAPVRIIEVTVEVTATPAATAVSTTTPLPQETDTPDTSTNTETINRIAFINDNGQVMTINPDGTDAQQLTKAIQRFQYPAWSPDNSQLALIGQDATGSAIYVVDADAREARPENLYNNNPIYLYWSPDGQQISFIANTPSSGLALSLVPADGSATSRILSKGAPFYWNWADNGEEILIHSGGPGRSGRVEMIAVTDGNANDELGRPGFFQSPGISANGRYWAYAQQSGINSQIAILDTETNEIQSEAHTGSASLTWSPTEPLLAYTSGNEPESNSFVGPLRLFNAQTGEVTLLSRDAVIGFFWSPNGRYIATFTINDPSLERDINASSRKFPLAKPAQQGNLPQLELVIFDTTTMEGKELFRYIPTLPFLTQFLPFFDQYALSHQMWSPQSDALVLPMIEENRNQIVIVSINSGEKQYLADGGMPFWSLR